MKQQISTEAKVPIVETTPTRTALFEQASLKIKLYFSL